MLLGNIAVASEPSFTRERAEHRGFAKLTLGYLRMKERHGNDAETDTAEVIAKRDHRGM